MKMFGDPRGEIRKAAKYISVSGDQLPPTGFDVEQRTESVDLQFKDVLIRVERLNAVGKAYWTHLRGKQCTEYKNDKGLARLAASVKLIKSLA
jgi:hypothetical protein